MVAREAAQGDEEGPLRSRDHSGEEPRCRMVKPFRPRSWQGCDGELRPLRFPLPLPRFFFAPPVAPKPILTTASPSFFPPSSPSSATTWEGESPFEASTFVCFLLRPPSSFGVGLSIADLLSSNPPIPHSSTSILNPFTKLLDARRSKLSHASHGEKIKKDDGLGKNERYLLKDFNGLCRSGEMALVIGRPGSGCTTFLKVRICLNSRVFWEWAGARAVRERSATRLRTTSF